MRKPYFAFPFMLFTLAIAITASSIAAPANAEGPAVVTVAGSITKSNRGPLGLFADIFFGKTHELAFDKGLRVRS
jgi:hypothetical protein